jgi:hypothetical protein
VKLWLHAGALTNGKLWAKKQRLFNVCLWLHLRPAGFYEQRKMLRNFDLIRFSCNRATGEFKTITKASCYRDFGN